MILKIKKLSWGFIKMKDIKTIVLEIKKIIDNIRGYLWEK